MSDVETLAPTPSKPVRIRRPPTWLLLALALSLQLAIIGSLVMTHWVIRDRGAAVLLQIAPVDPTDPLRGDYLTYTFSEVSEISRALVEGAVPKPGQTVYVPLEQAGGTWEPSYGVRTQQPSPEDPSYPRGTVVIRGTATSANEETVQISYGIEQYFVPEGKGTNLPDANRMVARVFVAPDGGATLDKLLVDGQAWP